MSKRNSSSSSGNTLFNYFIKSPTAATPKKVAKVEDPAVEELDDSPKENRSCNNGHTVKDTKTEPVGKVNNKIKFEESDNEDDVPVAPRRKRIRLISEQSSEDEEQEEPKQNGDNKMKEKLESSFKFEAKSPKSSPAAKTKVNPKSSASNIESLDSSFSSSNGGKAASENDEGGSWLHCRQTWLRPENIRDANRRKPSHPEYDPKTLYVPEEFISKQSPAHKQWWQLKSEHYDCVLFFKVGKFYELFHMDAAVGVNELGFSYMKGDFAHSGFPESAYDRMKNTLIQKGYRVARVEQTETPAMLEERSKTEKVKSKVVRREICQITCKGTEICGLLDISTSNAAANYMLAVAEQDLGGGRSKYGVCFIDTSIGVFHLGQFDDDKHSSRLLTTLAHHPPCLVLYERSMTNRSVKLLKNSCQLAKVESLVPNKQFWAAEHTMKTMAEKYYQGHSGINWPEGIKPMITDGDSIGLTPSSDYILTIRSLGACIYYLTESLLDIQIMEMSQFEEYQPPNMETLPKSVSARSGSNSSMPMNMVLDAITLYNLHIIGDDLSLVAKLNHCSTAMGKRLLQQWVCSPSCSLDVIRDRQKAISFLLENHALLQDVKALLNSLPDMDRLLATIHGLGNCNRSKNHPDSRAILYEMKTYSKRKVADFLSILGGFEEAGKVVKRFEECDSELLKKLTHLAPDGWFPDYSETLKFFKGAFDHELAKKDGIILPKKGVDAEYDGSLQAIEDIKDELEEYLKEQCKYFNCKVVYFGSDKKRYQLEVPESKCNKAGKGYHLEGTRKGFKRFTTEESRELLARMLEAENQKQEVLKGLSRRIFEKFSQSHTVWRKAIECISNLDVLISFAEYSRLESGEMCVPNIQVADDHVKPFISIKDGRHPCIPCLDDYIPNDTDLGHEEAASLVLLTGPNMGGKSTLMRQLGLLTIMAQIGCHIPASECTLTLVDRIFTRLGASDDIMTGQSTFLVEMTETAAILKHATPHSLILLDELGRGTSTYDGTAIAAAVVEDLCKRNCRTMFSTHYHTLVEDFRNNSTVALAHMACMVEAEENESEESENVAQETVTFLYKLSAGACPKSYGFNAARLAGIGKNITSRAHTIANTMEKEANLVAMFKKLFTIDKTNISDCIAEAKKLMF